MKKKFKPNKKQIVQKAINKITDTAGFTARKSELILDFNDIVKKFIIPSNLIQSFQYYNDATHLTWKAEVCPDASLKVTFKGTVAKKPQGK